MHTSSESPDASPRSAGRPRDPDVDRRIIDATLDIYGTQGWAGLTMDKVATAAHTGKTSLYSRWSTKEALLTAALQTEVVHIDRNDRSTRESLVALALARAEQYLGPHGVALLRFEVESKAMRDELADVVASVSTSTVLNMRHWLEEEIRRGRLATSRSAMEILEAIEGSAMMHAIVTTPDLLDKVCAALPRWAERLVDAQLG